MKEKPNKQTIDRRIKSVAAYIHLTIHTLFFSQHFSWSQGKYYCVNILTIIAVFTIWQSLAMTFSLNMFAIHLCENWKKKTVIDWALDIGN